MGKIEVNKQQKLDALFDSAYQLFLDKGIAKTSIDDIVRAAGVAKGTFYLYFKDKYEIRDRLIARTAGMLFRQAYTEMKKTDCYSLEDNIIFIVDYILDRMNEDKAVLRFISKNLSWGMFRQAMTENEDDANKDVLAIYQQLVEDNQEAALKAPETMLFLIIELASSTSFSTILENDPISYQELKPYLNESIRAIIRNHMAEKNSRI